MYTDIEDINIKIASLFPLQNQTTTSCLNYEQSKTSFYGTLNQNGIKHILIAPKNDIPYINYYFNGCNNEQATQVLGIEFQETGNYDLDLANKYQLITNKTIEAINSNYYDLIIIDYPIVDGNKNRNTENIKNALISLDKNITQLYNSVIQRNGTIYITSSYGINEALYNSKEELVNVNFSQKVPFIVVDNEMSKLVYSLTNGGISDLSTTILANLEIQPMEGMTGKNLITKSSRKTKKKNSKTILIIVVFLIIIAIAIIAIKFAGLI